MNTNTPDTTISRETEMSILDAILTQEETVKTLHWVLHKRLGQEYSNTQEQMQHSISMGKLAQAIIHLRSARGLIQDVSMSSRQVPK